MAIVDNKSIVLEHFMALDICMFLCIGKCSAAAPVWCAGGIGCHLHLNYLLVCAGLFKGRFLNSGFVG